MLTWIYELNHDAQLTELVEDGDDPVAYLQTNIQNLIEKADLGGEELEAMIKHTGEITLEYC